MNAALYVGSVDPSRDSDRNKTNPTTRPRVIPMASQSIFEGWVASYSTNKKCCDGTA